MRYASSTWVIALEKRAKSVRIVAHTIKLATAIAAAAEGADVLCITGGVSVGPHDHVKQALAEIGFEQHVWGVSLKPGKPFWCGVRGDQYAFVLPGNPVSSRWSF